MAQLYEDRIEIIRQAVAKVNTDDDSLDLNNVSFAAISNEDNENLTHMSQEWINSSR